MILFDDSKKDIELLSPAGSPASLCAAVENGADAVYLGAHSFSARSGAQNFSRAELLEAVRYCKIRETSVYLAVNTLIMQRELDELRSLVEYACEIGVDAVIVQDMGAAMLIKAMAPGLPLHASTQMTVHGMDGVRALSEAGFKRVVLSRELSAEEIEYICRNTGMEVEVFVHGALCVSYSGRCLMSSMIGGRSGNRGSCAQPCRLPYEFGYGVRGHNALSLRPRPATGSGAFPGYLLSMRDLCLARDIEALKRAGVRALKIEGRMKSPEYVAVVTGVYRRIIDTGEVTKEDMDRLSGIFCRGDGFTRAYFGREAGERMISPRFSNDRTGTDAPRALLKEAAGSFKTANKKVRADVEFVYENDERPFLELRRKNVSARVFGETDDSPPVPRDRIKEQVTKLGATPFYAGAIEIKVDGDCRIKISELNLMRRKAVKELEDRLYGSIRRNECRKVNYDIRGDKEQKAFGLSAFVLSAAQARAAAEAGVKRIYVPLHLCAETGRLAEKAELYAAVPAIVRAPDREKILSALKAALKNGVRGVLCDSLDGLALARETGAEITGGMGLNITNVLSLSFYAGAGLVSATLSTELSGGRIKALAKAGVLPLEAVIYGRLPLMLTENCIIRSAGGRCICEGILRDRTGSSFPVIKDGDSCRNIIYNSRPVFMADKLSDILDTKISFGQLYFTVEGPEECARIVRKYKEGGRYGGDFTRGYWQAAKEERRKT